MVFPKSFTGKIFAGGTRLRLRIPFAAQTHSVKVTLQPKPPTQPPSTCPSSVGQFNFGLQASTPRQAFSLRSEGCVSCEGTFGAEGKITHGWTRFPPYS